jgi:Rrf2 family protein
MGLYDDYAHRDCRARRRPQQQPADSTLMISQKAKYALRALVSLAQAPRGEPVFISDIAEQQSIPKKFLEQILLDLKRHGILISRRGKFGGYQLLKDPSEITFGSILRIVDGPIAPLPCLSKIAYRRCDDCKSEGNCEIRRIFAEVTEATRSVLDNRTIADAISGGVAVPRGDDLAFIA